MREKKREGKKERKQKRRTGRCGKKNKWTIKKKMGKGKRETVCTGNKRKEGSERE